MIKAGWLCVYRLSTVLFGGKVRSAFVLFLVQLDAYMFSLNVIFHPV